MTTTRTARLAAIAWMALLAVVLAGLAVAPVTATAASSEAVATRIDPSKLLVRPRNAAAPSFTADPAGWVRAKQRAFSERMQRALVAMRTEHRAQAGWTLILLSFVYGVLHAAGPGHGKAVVSAWLLANERQLRRGVAIALLAAFIQALSAIAIVAAVLGLAGAAGSTAKAAGAWLTAASYLLIALFGAFLIWQVARTWGRTGVALASTSPRDHHAHAHSHAHDASCDCGHDHLPAAASLDGEWSWRRAAALALAVGVRPCTGAVLVLLAASAVNLTIAGIVATFAMAAGVAITVSAIAIAAVTSRRGLIAIVGAERPWLSGAARGLKLAAGLFIFGFGATLAWASLA